MDRADRHRPDHLAFLHSARQSGHLCHDRQQRTTVGSCAQARTLQPDSPDVCSPRTWVLPSPIRVMRSLLLLPFRGLLETLGAVDGLGS
jgi:hypothetical protein